MNTISTLKFMKASVVNSFTLKHFRQHLLLMFAFILSSWSSSHRPRNLFIVDTWVAPAGVTPITVECWGGGKGGQHFLTVLKPVEAAEGLFPIQCFLLLFFPIHDYR
jgi:hypothetical protein